MDDLTKEDNGDLQCRHHNQLRRLHITSIALNVGRFLWDVLSTLM